MKGKPSPGSKEKSSFGIGLTATRSILLPAGSDHTLRRTIYHLFTISSRMEELRRLLGRRIGISGPQFSLLMAIAELGGTAGVSVGQLAEYLHVSGPFVTAESRKLADKEYIEKAADPSDLRVSRIRLSAKGRSALLSLLPEIQQVNDIFFDFESAEQFDTVSKALERLVESSRGALSLVNAAAADDNLQLQAGRLHVIGRTKPAARRKGSAAY